MVRGGSNSVSVFGHCCLGVTGNSSDVVAAVDVTGCVSWKRGTGGSSRGVCIERGGNDDALSGDLDVSSFFTFING